jgi:hypothetical protein
MSLVTFDIRHESAARHQLYLSLRKSYYFAILFPILAGPALGFGYGGNTHQEVLWTLVGLLAGACVSPAGVAWTIRARAPYPETVTIGDGHMVLVDCKRGQVDLDLRNIDPPVEVTSFRFPAENPGVPKIRNLPWTPNFKSRSFRDLPLSDAAASALGEELLKCGWVKAERAFPDRGFTVVWSTFSRAPG